jgi:hypothetical protein
MSKVFIAASMMRDEYAPRMHSGRKFVNTNFGRPAGKLLGF